MEKHYDTDGINVYLMLTDTDYQVSYETKMLQNNCIPYVLPFNVMFIDGDAIPCYEVNGLTEFDRADDHDNSGAYITTVSGTGYGISPAWQIFAVR